MKTIRLMIHSAVLCAIVSCALVTGCSFFKEHVQGGTASVTGNANTGDITGTIEIVFRGASGPGKVALSRANSRGYSLDGTRFVSLGDLKTIAIALYNEPSSNPAGFSQLTADDTRIVAIVLASLAKNSAQPGTLR